MSVTVVVDDREPDAVVEAVRSHPDVTEVVVRRLTEGDLVVGAVGVERKTRSSYGYGYSAPSAGLTSRTALAAPLARPQS